MKRTNRTASDRTKRTKQTALDRIVAQLRAILRRETTDIVRAGDLLIKSRRLFANEHGKWQWWLSQNFDLSYRTALRYETAAEYVARAKVTRVTFANLAPGVLYDLADGDFDAKQEAAILAAARRGRVDQTRAEEICRKLAPPLPPPLPPRDDDGGELDHGDETIGDSASIEKILAGPPPAVPPTATMVVDVMLQEFDRAVSLLKQVMTKPAARFANSVHAGDLEAVESFIHAVAECVRHRKTDASR